MTKKRRAAPSSVAQLEHEPAGQPADAQPRADQPAAAPVVDDIEDGAQYRVELHMVIDCGDRFLKPRTDTLVLGSLLRSIMSAVKSYAKI